MTIAVAVMAKAPRVGEVKTRLVPPLSAAEAASLGAAFIQDIAANILEAARAAPIAAFVAYAPMDTEALFRRLLPDAVNLLPSRRPGLAASLLDAITDLLAAGHDGVCLVNADSPTLPTRLLVDAAVRLRGPGDRAIFGPAEDGGYYLIGLKQSHRRLFEDIDWSTERVLRQSLDRAAELGLETDLLPPWYDVDDIASLDRLRVELQHGDAGCGQFAAPHTAACLRQMAEPARAPAEDA